MAISDIYRVFAAREEDLLPPIVSKELYVPLLEVQEIVESYRLSAAILSMTHLWGVFVPPRSTLFQEKVPCLPFFR